MNKPVAEVSEPGVRPLCSSYLFVLFESVPVVLQADDGACPGRRMLWALGVLPDGDNEVLGAWDAPESNGPAWTDVFEELAGRGVERIGFVVVGRLAPTERTLRDKFPNAILLPARMDKGMSPPGASAQAPLTAIAMSAGRYRKLVAADVAAQSLQRLVCRAIGRQRALPGPTDATAFLLDRLLRATQKTDLSSVPYGVVGEGRARSLMRRRKGARVQAPSL